MNPNESSYKLLPALHKSIVHNQLTLSNLSNPLFYLHHHTTSKNNNKTNLKIEVVGCPKN
jgi:hypothetical protein